MLDSSRRGDRPPSPFALSNLSLKDEDRACTAKADVCGEEVELLLVADGHGGPEVSQLCFEAALPLFEEEAAAGGDASGSSLRGGCTRAFERLHERAITLSKHAGTTLTLVAWNRARSELTVAHAGDSVALLVEGTAADGQATLLCAEHRLSDSAEERARVQAAGFRLGRAVSPRTGLASGPLRCFPGGLAVCRGIGDLDCGSAISTVPAMQTVVPAAVLAGGGAAVIVCSDGVWDALTHEQVAGYVRGCATAEEAAERVVSEAYKARGLRDDITAAVGWLGTPPWVAALLVEEMKRKAKRSFLSRISPNSSSSGGGSAPAV